MKFAESLEFSLEQEHDFPELFYLLQTTLEKLDSGVIDSKLLELWFLLNLSDELGFKIDLNRCAGCGELFSPPFSHLSYSFEMGGILCHKCAGYALTMRAESVALLRMLRNSALPDISAMPVGEDVLAEVSHILNSHAQNMYITRRVGEKTDMLLSHP